MAKEDQKVCPTHRQCICLEQQNHWCTESVIIMGSAWDKVSQEMNTNKEGLDVFKAKIEESEKASSR